MFSVKHLKLLNIKSKSIRYDVAGSKLQYPLRSIIDSVALLSKEKRGKNEKVEWIIQKPEIVILIDLSATVRHWRPSSRDDIKMEL